VDYAEVPLACLVRESREKLGLTQHQLANMLIVAPHELAAWEDGGDIPLDFAHELLEAMRLDSFPGEVDLVRKRAQRADPPAARWRLPTHSGSSAW
jgi:DNA-binding XRE family transcriptional regulator